MKTMATPNKHSEQICLPTTEYYEQAVKLLQQGQLVAFPTETVYGLGADASNTQAIQRIFSAKGRPSDNPLIMHVGDK